MIYAKNTPIIPNPIFHKNIILVINNIPVKQILMIEYSTTLLFPLIYSKKIFVLKEYC